MTQANMSAGVVTRSRSKGRNGTNGINGTNGTHGTNGTNGAGNMNGAMTNGFPGSKEGKGTPNETGVIGRMMSYTLNNVLFPLLLMTLCPQSVIIFWYTATKCEGSYAELLRRFEYGSNMWKMIEIWKEIDIFNSFTFGIVIGYFSWAIFWMVVLPGKPVSGPMTPKGNVPVYKDNGFAHYIVTMVGFAILTLVLKCYGSTPSVVYDRFGELLALMNVFALFFVLLLYFKGIFVPSTTDSGKNGAGFLFDYYWGTELYPRVFGIDIKVLTNCRYGMTVWPLLVCIFAIKSYELNGFVDSVFVSAILQLAYITKFFTWEGGYMSTIDIILDRAGFYICWGCLVWLPALYPLVSLYLVNNPVHLGTIWASIILGLGLVSVLINYLADLQRQQVRSANGKCLVWGRDPHIIRAKYTNEMGEVKESILLASGWWGVSRHFHYIPELMLSFFWTCTVGFSNLQPYTYVIYLAILLTHRSFRDEAKCSKKYGKYWQDYCKKVKYRIMPYVF